MSARLRTRVKRLEARQPPGDALRPRLILIRGVKPGDPPDLPLSWIEFDDHRFERGEDESEGEFRAKVERAVSGGRVVIGSCG